ncbi:MAG: T9SS type A sorting domain-containing protein [Chitinophagales bacterium]|nr:T9SS type A sorting domain-containing protein [Chitinophagales bacterium]
MKSQYLILIFGHLPVAYCVFWFTAVIRRMFGVAMLIMLPYFVQGQLLPTIGLHDVPTADDSICDIPLRLQGNFDELGFQEGSPVPDFTFYDIYNNPFTLSAALNLGKPALFITCSYTCPVFRDRLSAINALQAQFGDQVTIVLIYTVEAHPKGDVSPYFGFENVSAANYQEGILYGQPKTYGERLSIVSDMLANLQVNVPVYLDGPCNEFWVNYQCGPVTAYLVDTNGLLFSKHGWFNSFPDNMTNDLLLLLGNQPTPDDSLGGSVAFSLIDGPSAAVDPQEPAVFYGWLYNSDSSAGAVAEVFKTAQRLPQGWSASLCTDICYSPFQDYISVYLPAGDSVLFSLHVYTATVPDSAAISVRFRNLTDTLQQQELVFRVTTLSPPPPMPGVYPNPASGFVILTVPSQPELESQVRIFNSSGRVVYECIPRTAVSVLEVSHWPAGYYVVVLGNARIPLIKF